MRNIKLTETEWRYIKDALISSGDLYDVWNSEYSRPELDRKCRILKRAEGKIFSAKKEKETK